MGGCLWVCLWALEFYGTGYATDPTAGKLLVLDLEMEGMLCMELGCYIWCLCWCPSNFRGADFSFSL